MPKQKFSAVEKHLHSELVSTRKELERCQSRINENYEYRQKYKDASQKNHDLEMELASVKDWNRRLLEYMDLPEGAAKDAYEKDQMLGSLGSVLNVLRGVSQFF